MILHDDHVVGEYPLPIPPFFDPGRASEVWKVPYQERADEAKVWARDHHLQPSYKDELKIALILIDMQNTFCIPGFELFVGGRSGTGAVDDVVRIAKFIYHNLNSITQISLTLDTHKAMQIFHQGFLVNEEGFHPPPFTLISYTDIASGRWMFNRDITSSLGIDPELGQRYLMEYTKQLEVDQKYNLTIWPYHAMLGGIGHALVPMVEEAIFFHTIARSSQPTFLIKGDIATSESYSAIGPEVLTDPNGDLISEKSDRILHQIVEFDAVVFAGEAKSHCVSWTINDLLHQINTHDPDLTKKVYLLEDCSTPVVVPDVMDYTEIADKAYQHYDALGMHIVQSTDPITKWPGL